MCNVIQVISDNDHTDRHPLVGRAINQPFTTPRHRAQAQLEQNVAVSLTRLTILQQYLGTCRYDYTQYV